MPEPIESLVPEPPIPSALKAKSSKVPKEAPVALTRRVKVLQNFASPLGTFPAGTETQITFKSEQQLQRLVSSRVLTIILE